MYFAVWAPHAKAVGVVGDFNGWDPDAAPMSPLADSGIYEAFIPGVGLGVVFQDFRLLKDKTVYENVAFAQRVIGESSRTIRESVPQMLKMVGLSSKYKFFPHQLSGGEQQRVAIARALINRPEILLADEPTGNLDPHNAMEIMGLLEKINRRGTTVIVVTHSHEIVDLMKKRVITIDRGMVVCDEEESGYRYED